MALVGTPVGSTGAPSGFQVTGLTPSGTGKAYEFFWRRSGTTDWAKIPAYLDSGVIKTHTPSLPKAFDWFVREILADNTWNDTAVMSSDPSKQAGATIPFLMYPRNPRKSTTGIMIAYQMNADGVGGYDPATSAQIGNVFDGDLFATSTNATIGNASFPSQTMVMTGNRGVRYGGGQ